MLTRDTNPLNPDALIGFNEVADLNGRVPDRTTRVYFWRLMRAGKFPPAIQVSDNRIAWRRGAILKHLAERPTVTYAAAR